jgi:hypothetical protein
MHINVMDFTFLEGMEGVGAVVGREGESVCPYYS